MLEEINRTARDLNLSESLPLELTNAAIFIDTPAYFIHTKTLGTVDTKNYVFNFSAGKTVSGVDANSQPPSMTVGPMNYVGSGTKRY